MTARAITTKGATVYVVMGNDYPAAVFETAKDAEKYCVEQQKSPRSGHQGVMTRIHWRHYAFVVR